MNQPKAKRPPPSKEAAAIAAEANALERAGRFAEARAVYERLVQLDRHNPVLHKKLALLCVQLNDFHGAVKYFRQSLKLDPANREVRNKLASTWLLVGRPDKAEKLAQRSFGEDPRSIETLKILLECLTQFGRSEAARKVLETALEIEPDDQQLKLRMGLAFDLSADPEKASQTFWELIDSGHASAPVYNGLARVRTHTTEPPELGRMEKLLLEEKLSEFDRGLLHQSAAKILDDLGRHGEAFEHFAAGRSALAILGEKHGTLPADQLDRYRELFTREFFTERASFGNKSQHPVFIFGMPRSGTTLMEQILASHPKGYGAGELMFFDSEVAHLTQRGRTLEDIARAATGLTRETSQEIARDYLDLLTAYSAQAERVTDKMPHNFERLWLLALAFPKASFIHCRRDPVATCVSCFTQPLNQFHTYARDLTSLGRYYRSYENLMALWRDVLPVNLLEVDYEQLVRDPEPQIRRIVDHVGLEWDDACLSSHKTKRWVKTPSRSQVEKPIHTGAITNWRRFEPFLGPLFEALGDSAAIKAR